MRTGWMLVGLAGLLGLAVMMGQGNASQGVALSRKITQLTADRNKNLVIVPSAELAGHQDGVLAVDFSPDGKMLASGSADKTVKLWDVAAKKELATLKEHKAPVMVVKFSRDGKHLLTAATDKSVVVWNTETRSVEAKLAATGEVTAGGFLMEGLKVVLLCGGELQLWDMSKPSSDAVPLGKVHLTTMDMNEQGEIVAGTDNGRVMIINLQATSEEGRIAKQHVRGEKMGEGPANVIHSVVFLKNGTILIADRQAVWVWERNGDSIKFVARKAVEQVVPLKEDMLIGWWAGNEFGWTTADFKTVPPSFRRDNAHAIAYSGAANVVAYAHGGSFAGGNFLTAGPQTVDLFDVSKFEGWAKADEMLRQAQMELPGASKVVNRLTDEGVNKDLGMWK